MRLRTVSPNQPGWTRRRQGRGFLYLDESGQRLDDPEIERCRALVIPPAWQEVWICPRPNGHIQAVGTDAAGRRQYMYHPEWRRKRDEAKHDRILTVAERLPRARALVAEHLALDGMPRDKALATAFRLLDLGFFRIGGESYAEQNGSYGLATIEKQHTSIDGERVIFEYTAKSGKERHIEIADDDVRGAVEMLRRRRGGGDELLAYQDETGSWHDITTVDINEYVKEVVGGEVSAKDFRTWHATVLAAVALAVSTQAAASPTARKRAIARAMREVADYLGNTPTVARASYVDPRIIDLFEDGVTIERDLLRLGEDSDPGQPATHGGVEKAVLRLLSESPDSTGRARRGGLVARR
jgi:DNA topoisomerase I